ncbi:unnamed protein product, partial [Laminaria digitata]
WEATQDEGITNLIKHEVYDPVPLTAVHAGSKIVCSWWVCKIKPDDAHKARGVVIGWGMVAGAHCGSTFAPVRRLQSMRVVLAQVAGKNLEVSQYDVPTALFNSPVDEKIFVKMAPKRKETHKDGIQQVMRLRKILYGIPRAPADSHGTIDNFVTAIEFTPLKSDPCIYVYTHKDGIHNPVTKKEPTFASWNKYTVILTIYVDYLLLVGKNKLLLKRLAEPLMRRFDTKCMGDVPLVLGTQVTRDRKKGTLTISQTHYTSLVLE